MKENVLGVALTRCFFCCESDKILMNIRLTPEMAARVEQCNGKVTDMEPCPKCQDLMKQGIILIGIVSEKSSPNWHMPDGQPGWMPNPYRSGSFLVLREKAVRRIFNGDGGARDFALKHRWVFVEEAVCEMLRQGGRECGDIPPEKEEKDAQG